MEEKYNQLELKSKELATNRNWKQLLQDCTPQMKALKIDIDKIKSEISTISIQSSKIVDNLSGILQFDLFNFLESNVKKAFSVLQEKKMKLKEKTKEIDDLQIKLAVVIESEEQYYEKHKSLEIEELLVLENFQVIFVILN
jgi:broad-specificity NMP kinase